MNVNTSQRNAWSDEELMKAYQLGDESAFSVLYQRYSGKVYGYLRFKWRNASDVQEVFQEVFMKLHRMRSKYKATEPFTPWLYTMMRNVLVDHARKVKSGVQLSFGKEWLNHIGADPEADDSHSNRTDLSKLPGFKALRAKQREALQMRYKEDRSFSEIASHLVTTEENVRKLISRAIGKLKESSLKEETRSG